eukprot:CAMPEP_0202043556 /NCGR_PEP_ID=MMETSP0962-20130828/30736_1 /ASSEMBLY_ACC=CAM_ASM_000488 /TAXON_ID=4773 /ORGANISM="Schizochytrium aggregatum, Strain ATCC28209" /LENGTH=49 /DNA_ID=CAMNT_0048608045 /DNA_START=65 /DNA_END=214 /DNA_ORIENTATION=-
MASDPPRRAMRAVERVEQPEERDYPDLGSAAATHLARISSSCSRKSVAK